MNQLEELRHHHDHQPLTTDQLDPDPLRQCQIWLDLALQQDFYQPNAMTLATTDAHGQPSARTVLLKQITAQGLTFYTNFNSRKGQELDQNNQVALLLYWDQLERQIRIEGKAQKLDHQHNQQYFATRPYDSQISAWASPQSQVIPNREYLRQQFEDTKKRIGTSVDCPPFWGGYLVVPDRVEFWQGQSGRLHDRLRYYQNQNGNWLIERLAP